MSNIYAQANDKLIILCHARKCKVHRLLAASKNKIMFNSKHRKAICSQGLQTIHPIFIKRG